jgi:crossover junction endodeoxyribonuclease RusA
MEMTERRAENTGLERVLVMESSAPIAFGYPPWHGAESRPRAARPAAVWTLTAPWPARELSPNARGHWSRAARAKRLQRASRAFLAHQAGLGGVRGLGMAWEVHLAFAAPCRRARDLDNLLAACKAGLDGLADAMGVDDRHWRISIDRADPAPGGRVEIEVRLLSGDRS